MNWLIWKNKPWRDRWWQWRIVSAEFTGAFSSFRTAYQAKHNRCNDHARTIIMPDWKWLGAMAKFVGRNRQDVA
jgi:hypothetical protein